MIPSKASASVHRAFARFHIRACRENPAIQAIGDQAVPFVDDLRAKSRAVEDAEEAEADAQGALQHANNSADDALRALYRDAQSLDAAEPGLGAAAKLFPKGLTPEVAPSGANQKKPTEGVRRRLDQKPLKGKPIATTHGPLLDQAISALAVATTGLETATKAVADARAADEAARAALREQLTKNEGQLIALLASKGRAARYFPKGKKTKEPKAAPDAAPAAPPPEGHHGTAGPGTI